MPRSASETKLIMEVNPGSHIAEAYRNLRTNIQFSSWDHDVQVLAVTSTQRGEGKSTTISNLAVSYAQEGKNVILIDADLRRPSLQRMFSLPNKIGLSNILANQYPYSEVVRKTYIENLSIIPSGMIPPNPSELLSSGNLDLLLENLKSQYDIILLDTPPIMAVADGLVIASKSDGVIFVVQVGKASRQLIKKSKAKLEHVKANILGVVLNKKKFFKSESHYYDDGGEG